MPADAPTTSAHSGHTSEQLFARARLGDSVALGRLLQRYLPPLRRWAHNRLPRWARSSDDTSDLIQDAVLRTIPRLGTFEVRGQGALGAYLRAAVQHRIQDVQRHVARRGPHDQLREGIADSAPSPSDLAVRGETEVRYRHALASLAAEDRELIVAHLELDYSHHQLGCMIGRTPDAARMALHRAIRRLAERMRDV